MIESFLAKPLNEKIRQLFISLVCCYIALMPIFPTFFRRFGYTPNIEIRNYLIIGSLTLLILWMIANLKNGLKMFNSPIIFSWLTFLSFAGLSISWGINQYEGYLVIIQWLGGFTLFLLLGLILRDDKDIRSIVYSILIAGIITAVIGQIQSHGSLLDEIIVQAVPPASVFANKNMAAHMMSLSLAVAVCLFLRSQSVGKNILYAIIVAVMASYILFTRTRAAWLAFIVMTLVLIGFLIWMSKKKSTTNPLHLLSQNKIIGYVVFVITFIALVTIGDTPIDMQRAEKLLNFQADSNDRIPMFLNTFNMFFDYPIFGVGLGNWTVHYPYYMASEFNDFVFSLAAEHYHTHNDILQVLSETGIVGLLMIGTTVYLAFNALVRAINRETSNQIFIYLAILLAMVQILVNSVASFPFQLSAPIMIFFCYFALAALVDQKISAKPFYHSKQKFLPIALLIPLSVLLIAGSIVLADWKKSEEYYYRSMIAWKMNNPDMMIASANEGFQFNPMRLKLLDFISGGFILRNEHEKALPILNQVLQKYPYRLNTLHYKARSLFSLGRVDQARETMEFLLSLKPVYAPGYDMLAVFDAESGDNQKAMENLIKAIELDPNNHQYLHKYAVLLIRESRFVEAREYFEKALAITPNNALYNKNLGILYTNMINEPIKGIPYLERALELNPDIADRESIDATLKRYYKYLSNQLKTNQN